MRKNKFLVALAALTLLFGAGLTACGNNGDNNQSEQEKITITAAEGKKTLVLGESVQLTASVDGVTWSSSEVTVATVSASGLVESKGAGRTTIKAVKNGYKDGSLTINVELPKVVVTPSSGTVKMEETLQLTADQAGVTWASNNENIATVDQTGKVTGVNPGSAEISASKDGYTAGKASITVTRPDPIATLSFDDAAHYSADGWWGTGEEGYLPYYERSSGNASDGKCLAHFGAGDKETLTFTVSKVLNAELVIMMAASSEIADMSAVMSATLNGGAINLDGKSFAGGSTSEFAEFSLGSFDLIKEDDNVLVLEFVADSGTPYIDDLMFYGKNPNAAEIAVKKAPEMPKITVKGEITKLDAVIGEGTQLELANPASFDDEFVCTSDKPEIASVTNTGLIQGLKFGIANITIRKPGYISARIEVTVDKAKLPGEIRVQAEDLETVPDGFHMYTDRTSGIQNGHYGGAYITGYDVTSETIISYKFESPSNQTMRLIIAGAPHYNMTAGEIFSFKDDCDITLNEAAVTVNPDAEIEGTGAAMGAATVEVEIGDVNVKEGENTFTIVFHESAPALDAFRFIPLTSLLA